MLYSDVELTQVQKSSQQDFSVCQQDLNSIFGHNFAKIFLIKAYVVIHKFDIICLSEAYLTRVYLLTMTIWILMDTTWSTLIIHQTLNTEEFVPIIEIISFASN